MKYKILDELKNMGISYRTQASWIGISGAALLQSKKIHDPEDDLPQNWKIHLIKKINMLEALLNGAFS